MMQKVSKLKFLDLIYIFIFVKNIIGAIDIKHIPIRKNTISYALISFLRTFVLIQDAPQSIIDTTRSR